MWSAVCSHHPATRLSKIDFRTRAGISESSVCTNRDVRRHLRESIAKAGIQLLPDAAFAGSGSEERRTWSLPEQSIRDGSYAPEQVIDRTGYRLVFRSSEIKVASSAIACAISRWSNGSR